MLDGAAMAAPFKRKRWREAQRLRVDLNGMMVPLIGETGLSEAELEDLAPRLAEVHAALERQRRAGALGFAELPHAAPELRRTLALVEQLRGGFDDLVVLGIGGSAVGARALYGALKPPGHAWAPVADGEMRLHVADTIDPCWLGALLARLDLRRTLFNVVSKSGETAETMGQFLVVRDRLLKELGAVEYKQHIVVTTDAAHGALRQIVNDEGFRDLVAPANVGGHFSVLTAAGLFPAACAGIDVAEVLAGAADMDDRCRQPDMRTNPALAQAGALYLAIAKGRGVVVIMPYAEALSALGDWFCQLWAESLGKAADLTGRQVHTGQTPVRAIGPADQHGQLQLYVEGPADKLVIFLRVEEHAGEIAVPESYDDLEAVAYLGGLGLGALLNLEQQGAELALAKAGCMNSTIRCPSVNGFAVGQLVYLLEMEAALIGGLLGVNPLSRPAVEEGKHLTYGVAGRPGYEARRAEVQRWAAKKEARYVV
jgi:glucose-6-phosphate isomerase